MYRPFILVQSEQFMLKRKTNFFIVLGFEIQIFKDETFHIDLGITGHKYVMVFITSLQPLIIIGTDLLYDYKTYH